MIKENDSQLVSLEEMLMVKEIRVQRQTDIIQQNQTPIICFTMNIMGPIKNCSLYEQGFQAGKRLIMEWLDYAKLPYHECFQTIEKTGCECIWSVSASAKQIKQLMIEVEESEAIGRVFDIDVLDIDGMKVSRTELGYQSRRCLICDDLAAVCARSRNHGLDQLIAETRAVIENYLANQYADEVASKAQRALLYEVSVTPKAGLVDRMNNGSHQDMDFITFIDSSTALVAYFRKSVLSGIMIANDEKRLFERLRSLGKQAEINMYRSTNGVNTHKGAIFSLGILCGAAGALWKRQERFTITELCQCAANIAIGSLKDFEKLSSTPTNGEVIYKKYGISGARAEAAAGFCSVNELALPTLQKCLSKGYSVNDSSVWTLLVLISQVYDTNIIKRSDLQTQTDIHSQITEFLDQEPDMNAVLEYMEALDIMFMEKNISAGGCADLLAVAWLLQLLTEIK